MPFIDHVAARRLADLREAAGHSPESLALAIREAAEGNAWGERGTAHTIRRIEREGHVPGVRVRFVVAHFFGLPPHKMWQSRNKAAVGP